jgi:DNA-binding CsgD family transcriptional regulator
MLLEREGELAVLGGLVEDIGNTGGKVVLIRGEAGIGKSSLVDAFLAAHADRTLVLGGACDDLFIPQPLAPFWDMARSEPSLRGPIDVGDRPRLLDHLMELLSRKGRPTVVIIEDTHWADEATLDAIRFLGRRVARTNGMIVLTYRDGEVDYDHPLRGVIGDIPAEATVRIQLHGLTIDAVSTLIEGSQLEPSSVIEATRGNPFMVREMRDAGAGSVTASLQDSLMGRVHKLSIGAQEMLKTLSVIPEAVPRQDALQLVGIDEERLDEGQQRGLLESAAGMVAFRHELIRRAVESSMSEGERLAKYRAVLQGLPEETHTCLLIHCAAELEDVDRLLDLAPRSARYAAIAGGHIQAAEDFRELKPYLGRFSAEELGPLLDEWAHEEFLVDQIDEAIRLNQLARDHYRATGDPIAESRALAQAAHYQENAGHRDTAEERAREAIEVLGADAGGPDLARALEVNAYLQMMAGNVAAVPELVERTLEAGGPDIDDAILIRSLNHSGIVANIANYPDGRADLDEARERAAAGAEWYEECRALFNHAWAAAEFHDVPVASDYARRGIESAGRHELPGLEGYAKALYARALELHGDWNEAANLAREVMDGAAITRMVALPILGSIESRKGRASAGDVLAEAWRLAFATDEFQRLAPAAIAVAEHGWLAGTPDMNTSALSEVLQAGLRLGFSWSTGKIAYWLWQLGDLDTAPAGIADPFRLVIQGDIDGAAAIWEKRGIPYERALTLTHGDEAQRLQALEALETLGATAVAAKLRQSMRDQGVAVPRGKGRETRRNIAGLTARQAEVLQLLDEDLSNTEIADRLFLSPRTVENHVSAVLDKLDVATRDEAVERARADGLLDKIQN